MSRRIDIELTSPRDDGSWTWRAAGAREPRGTVPGALVPSGSQVGNVLRAEIDGYLDQMSVVAVLPPKAPRREPKRLRPGKAHRTALLEAVPPEQRPIAEQLLQGGIPAVRQAIDKQNESLRAEGKTEVKPEPLLRIAEELRYRAAAAVWRDRAEAAIAAVDELDLRDLRSVVSAASDAGRDEEARALASQLREALANRVEKEHAAWLAELADALAAEASQDRWATVLDALAFSPVRRRVLPQSLPTKLSPELRATVARVGSRLPEIAHIFAIEPDESVGRTPSPRGQARRGAPRGKKARATPPAREAGSDASEAGDNSGDGAATNGSADTGADAEADPADTTTSPRT